jgi:hypothetical protein
MRERGRWRILPMDIQDVSTRVRNVILKARQRKKKRSFSVPRRDNEDD